MSNLVVPNGYWSGYKRLENELPWLTPKSILKLDDLLTEDMKVLEFGSGGSTLFFSKRVKSVLSFESDQSWIDKVHKILLRKKITNVEIVAYSSEKDLSQILPTELFNCVLIDNVPKKSNVTRDWILQRVTGLLRSPKVLILDNYNLGGLFFPVSRLLSDKEFIEKSNLKGCKVISFNHPEWRGKGTKIYYGS